jgi:Rieske Fe-S protein
MSHVDRREFVRRAATGALAGVPLVSLLAGCAALMARVVPVREGKLHLALTHFPELAQAGGSAKVMPEGQTVPVYVLAIAPERWVALSPICTHLGCTVEIHATRIVCPCHGSTYDREGRVLQGPAERALARFPVAVSADGVLTIDLQGTA